MQRLGLIYGKNKVRADSKGPCVSLFFFSPFCLNKPPFMSRMRWEHSLHLALLFYLFLSLSHSLFRQEEHGVFPSRAQAMAAQSKRKINRLSAQHLTAGSRRLRRVNRSEQRTEWEEWNVLNKTDWHPMRQRDRLWEKKSWWYCIYIIPLAGSKLQAL